MPKQPWLASIAIVILSAASAADADAQAPADANGRLQVSVSAAGANLFQIEHRSFGKTFNFGGGAALRLRRQLWLELEANRFVGLEPDRAPCGLVNIECIGGGRTGYRSATVASLGLTYEFAAEGVRAAVTGAYDFIRARGFDTTTFAVTGQQVERTLTDDGWGPSAGLSLRVPIRSAWSLEPSLRIYGADAPNLTVVRASIGLSRTF